MARKQHKPRSKAFKAACYYQLIRLVDLDDEVSTARIPVRPETDTEFRDRAMRTVVEAALKQPAPQAIIQRELLEWLDNYIKAAVVFQRDPETLGMMYQWLAVLARQLA